MVEGVWRGSNCHASASPEGGDNANDYVGEQVSEIFNKSLRRARIEKANQGRIEFWRSRGIEIG
jgi:hypothetical protein